MNTIAQAARKRLIMAGVLLFASTAIVASARPLFVADAAANELSCVDIGCRSNTQCQDNGCDLCHTDNRCALVAEDGAL